MGLANRIYLVVHLALTVVVCLRHAEVADWQWHVAWNTLAIAAIVVFARKRGEGSWWEFANDWLPALFFITVFEQVSFLALSLQGTWQNGFLVAWESALFAAPPAEWLQQFSTPWFSELLEFGYFTFFPLYPAVAGVLWAWRHRLRFEGAFRHLTDSLSVGYVICYATYLLFPTRSPAHDAGIDSLSSRESGGPFHLLVRLIQGRAGVHGNAFPSAHIMLASVVMVFCFRYLPRLAPWLLVLVVLMGFGAVYDGYHYALDVFAGGLLGIVVGVAYVGKHPVESNKG